MTHLHRLRGLVLNRPHYIMPDAAEAILDVLAGRIGVEPVAAIAAPTPEASRFRGEPQFDERVGSTGYRLTAHGTAIVPVIGELVNRGAYVGASSGLVSYEGLRFALDHADKNGKVRSILLDLASPGGMASGMAETADLVRAIAARKPVVAIANDMAASAAYGIAAQASKVYVTQAGLLGSVGVVLMHADYSGSLEKKGVKVTLIHAGAHKVDGNPYEPLPAAVRKGLKEQVDKHYAAFVALVAKGRPALSADAIRATEAQVFIGQDAVDAGLADGVKSFEDVLAELDGRVLPRMDGQRAGVTMTANTTKGAAMSDAARSEAQDDTSEAKIKAVEAEVGKAKSLGEKEGAAKAAARIAAILDHKAAAGRTELARHLAFKTSMSAEEAIAALEAAPQKAAHPDPVVGAGVTPNAQAKDMSEREKGRAAGDLYARTVLGRKSAA